MKGITAYGLGAATVAIIFFLGFISYKPTRDFIFTQWQGLNGDLKGMLISIPLIAIFFLLLKLKGRIKEQKEQTTRGRRKK